MKPKANEWFPSFSSLPFLPHLQATDKAGADKEDTAAAAVMATRADMVDTVTIMVAIGRDGATTVMITPTTVNSTTIHRNTSIERLFSS